MRRTTPFFCAQLAAYALLLAGCAHQPIPSSYDPPGFLMGVVHGAVMPLALVGSIFSDIRIYAFPNSGGGYDFGYFIGLCLALCLAL